MDNVSVAHAKAHFSEVLAAAAAGHDVVITRRGKPVARVSGVRPEKRSPRLDAIDAFRDSHLSSGERSVDLVRRMRDASY